MKRKIHRLLNKTFLGALLIGGTAIGAAMLANPVATAGSGILPSYFIYILCWMFSAATGCLFIELCSWLPKNSNLLTMAETFLGQVGKWLVFSLYMFLFYFLLIAYTSLGGRLVLEAICPHIPYIFGVFAFILFFGGFIWGGAKVSSRLNALLMVGLVLSFIIFIFISGEKASVEQANYWGWKYAFLGLPIIFTSFSYQGTVPTLYAYLDCSVSKAKTAVIFGTLIPLFAYLIWDYLIKGIIPAEGVHGLIEAKTMGLSAVDPLFYAVSEKKIYTLGRWFSFFALTTSFIGVALGMVDFFADLFHVKACKLRRLYLCLLIFVPVVMVVLSNPSIFLTALSFAGGFGSALLLGVLPIVLVWMGRANGKFASKKRVLFGGNAVLFILLMAIIAELVVSVCVLL